MNTIREELSAMQTRLSELIQSDTAEVMGFIIGTTSAVLSALPVESRALVLMQLVSLSSSGDPEIATPSDTVTDKN